MKVLVVDVGGSKVKLWLSEPEKAEEFESGDKMTPQAMVSQTLATTAEWQFDVVALGLPCRVIEGRPVREPQNLGDGWIEFNYEMAFGTRVRIINDADLQALGSYRGGRMLFLGLGTGVGSSLIAHHTLISIDAGVLLDAGGQEIGQVLNREGRKTLGNGDWKQAVVAAALRVKQAFFADEVVIGGGQADRLSDLPEGLRCGANDLVLAGGVRLWSHLAETDLKSLGWRIV